MSRVDRIRLLQAARHQARRRWILLAAVVVPALALGATCRSSAPTASQATVLANADTYVSSQAPNTTAAGSSSLRVDGTPEVRAFLSFDLTNTRGTLVSATLRLRASTDTSQTIQVSTASPDWSERQLTWPTAPQPGLRLAALQGSAAGEWVTADVTKGTTLGRKVAFVVWTTGPTSQLYDSRESANPPQLDLRLSSSAAAGRARAHPVEAVLAAVGDIACDPSSQFFNRGTGTKSSCRQMATSDLILRRHVDAVAVLGDSQYEKATLANFQSSYDPSWGRLRGLTKPAVGNHEYLTHDGSGYFSYFGAVAGDPQKAYYSYDLGRWHVVVLNSNCSRVGGCEPGSPQETWLRADLAAHSEQKCTVAYWHHPRWSSGRHGDSLGTAPLYEALYESGVEVLLSGHDHNYERFRERSPDGADDPGHGVRQFVVGTGGKNHVKVTPGSHTEASNDDTYGVLILTLRSDSYDWQFVPAAGQSYTDSGSTDCH